jgi:hypothetical protein
MKIRFLEKTFVGTGGNVFPGDEREIEDGMAQRLIARGIAEEAKKRGRKKKMSLSDRAVDAEELEIPEAE